MKSYKEYLESVHAEKFPQVLDDDMPDAFDAWVSNLDNSETAQLITGYIASVEHECNLFVSLKSVNTFYF